MKEAIRRKKDGRSTQPLPRYEKNESQYWPHDAQSTSIPQKMKRSNKPSQPTYGRTERQINGRADPLIGCVHLHQTIKLGQYGVNGGRADFISI